MPSTFWTNTIWFLLLGLTIIIELILIFTKAKDRKLVLALYLTITGLTFVVENVLAGFNAYQYFPKLLPKTAYDDSVMDNFFSQFSVSATALLIAVYNLQYYWYFSYQYDVGFQALASSYLRQSIFPSRKQ